MKKLHALSMTCLVMAVFTFTLSALIAADDIANDETKNTPSIPEIKSGDKVFFRIIEYKAISPSGIRITEPKFDIFELRKNKPDAYQLLDINEWEFCVTNDKDFEYQIDSPKSKKLEQFVIVKKSVKEITTLLTESMKANPDDREKWVVTLTDKKTGNYVTLTFAGIARVYQLKSVNVPLDSPLTKHTQYKNGHAPKFRVYIDKNGENMGEIEAKVASWEMDFPASDKNRWEIREGMKNTYLIRLRDWNTSFREHPIMQVSGIKAEDFARGEIFEKLEKLSTKDRAVKFVFEPIK